MGQQRRGEMILSAAWQGCFQGRCLLCVVERSNLVEEPEENDTGDPSMKGCMEVEERSSLSDVCIELTRPEELMVLIVRLHKNTMLLNKVFHGLFSLCVSIAVILGFLPG